MKAPWWLKGCVAGLLVAGLAATARSISKGDPALDVVANLALIATLAVLLFYTYYTFLLAREAWSISAGFGFEPDPADQFVYRFNIVNHSRQALSCWCKLNARALGQAVELGGFYSGESSVELQPLGGFSGVVEIRELLARGPRRASLSEMERAEISRKDHLALAVEFWYRSHSTGEVVRNPIQRFYFDMTAHVLVADA